jgi:hypothetical protein
MKQKSKLEIAIINDSKLTRLQKERIFDIMGKAIPKSEITESQPLKIKLSELLSKSTEEMLSKEFDTTICSRRLKNVLDKLRRSRVLTVGQVSEMALNGKIEAERNAGRRSAMELVIILSTILKKKG